MRYASGRHALGECQRCSDLVPLRELREDGYRKNLRVCRDCYDPRPPQEEIPSVEDPQALFRPAPEHAPDGEGYAADDFAGTACPLLGSYNIVELAVVDCMIVRD